jgi:hypothetical protein
MRGMSRLRRLEVSDRWFHDAPVTPSGLLVDRVLLTADPRTRI